MSGAGCPCDAAGAGVVAGAAGCPLDAAVMVSDCLGCAPVLFGLKVRAGVISLAPSGGNRIPSA